MPNRWRHDTKSVEAPASNAAPSVDLQRWWKPFQEPALDRLITEVVQSNLSVREGLARLHAARAMERAESVAYRPEAQFSAAPESTPDARQTFYELGLDAGWELGLFGRDAAGRQAASADTAIALADVQTVYAAVVAETARAYIEWRAAQTAASNSDAQIAAQTQRAQLMRTRLRLRLSSSRDVDGEETRLVELRTRRLALDRTIVEATEKLGLLLGGSDAAKPGEPADVASRGIPSLTAFHFDEVPANLLRTRADVRRAEQTVLKAGAELNLARADLYPRLTLGGSLMLALPIAGAGGAARMISSAGPAIEIPLFDWGRRRARVTAQDAALDAALIAYRESILVAIHEVETALGSLATLREDAELRRTQVASAEQAERRARSAAQLRQASELDVLAARISKLEAAASLFESERAYALAYIALFQALGGASLPAISS